MAKKRSVIQRLSLVPVFAIMFGAATAILVASTPQWLFDATVSSSGISGMMHVAQPPLGIKIKLLAALAVFAVIVLAVWFVGRGIERLASAAHSLKHGEDLETLDRVQVTPIEPPLEARRRPIFADRELGAPLMSDEALATAASFSEPFPAFDPTLFDEKLVEDELFAMQTRENTTRSGFDTPGLIDHATLRVPLAIEEFAVSTGSDEAAVLPGESSIDALIRRLEAGLARRAAPNPPHPGARAMAAPAATQRDWLVREADTASFDEDATRALGTLRRMAS
jgi:hypothetical protein